MTASAAQAAAKINQDPSLDAGARRVLEKQALGLLANLGYTGLTTADLPKLLPADIYEDELDAMAEVRAYFQVAYKVGHRLQNCVAQLSTTVLTARHRLCAHDD